MKQCIKQSIIIILTALLHNSAIAAAEFSCTPTGYKAECCLSQAPTPQQAIQDFYYHFSIISLCVEQMDGVHVPDNKITLLRASLYSTQQRANSPQCDRLLHVSPHPVPDANYYIFGLRKILI